MTTQYIIMNKEENRIYSECVSNNCPTVTYWSGDLSVTQFPVNFQPKTYNSWVKAKCRAVLEKGVVIKLKQTEYPYPIGCNEQHYLWLQNKETHTVYRIWNQGCKHKPNNCSLFRKDNTIMLKGIGDFDFSDFLIFDFN